MILLIDNYDSFTYNLLNYCKQVDEECHLIRNDEKTIEEIEAMDPQAFIFSPGPGKPGDHPLMYQILERWYNKKPILGICLGFQAISEFFGGTTEKAPIPCHGKVSIIQHDGHKAFKGIPKTFKATRYHSLIASDIPQDSNLKVIASTKDQNLPMALAHNDYPVWGFQFHPEAILTEHGLKLIRNWFGELKSAKSR